MYTLLHKISKLQEGNIKILLNLFDRTAIPMRKYNSEVWASSFFTQTFIPTDLLSEKQLKNRLDRLHCSFLKQILSVNSKTKIGEC